MLLCWHNPGGLSSARWCDPPELNTRMWLFPMSSPRPGGRQHLLLFSIKGSQGLNTPYQSFLCRHGRIGLRRAAVTSQTSKNEKNTVRIRIVEDCCVWLVGLVKISSRLGHFCLMNCKLTVFYAAYLLMGGDCFFVSFEHWLERNAYRKWRLKVVRKISPLIY